MWGFGEVVNFLGAAGQGTSIMPVLVLSVMVIVVISLLTMLLVLGVTVSNIALNFNVKPKCNTKKMADKPESNTEHSNETQEKEKGEGVANVSSSTDESKSDAGIEKSGHRYVAINTEFARLIDTIIAANKMYIMMIIFLMASIFIYSYIVSIDNFSRVLASQSTQKCIARTCEICTIIY